MQATGQEDRQDHGEGFVSDILHQDYLSLTCIRTFYSSKEAAATTMFGSREERDEEGERDRARLEREERLKRNQEWRAR